MAEHLKCQILDTLLTSATASEAVAFLCDSLVGIADTKKDYNQEIRNRQETCRGAYICYATVNTVMYAREREDYRNILNNAVMTFPGSRQLITEMHTQGYPKAERIDIIDFMKQVFSRTKTEKIRHFFYGSTKEALEKLTAGLMEEYPGISIAGTYAPPFGACTEDEDAKAVEMIQKSNADIIWVGLGMPMQEEWLHAHKGLFEGVMIGCGYGIDVLAGMEKQPPEWMKKCSLDWVYRMLREPKRLLRKYLSLNLKYVWLTGKKTIINTFSWVPAFMVIMTIFILSSQNGVASISSSEQLALQMANAVSENREYKNVAETDALEALNGLIRMVAHMGEYAILSLCVGFAVTVNGVRKRLRLLYMSVIGIGIAVLDEVYQIFIPGRYGSLSDIFFDAFGVVATALLLYIIGRNVKNRLEVPVSSKPRRRKFMNLCIDDISFDDAVKAIADMAEGNEKRYVLTPNADHVMKIEEDAEFRRIYESADLILTDGTPLMWIADSLGYPIKEKIPGADMLPRICEEAAKRGLTLFFLGAAEGVAERAKEKLTAKYPGLKIIGTYSPPLHFEEDEEEVQNAIQRINEKNADILVAALGSPKQEKFIYRYRDKLHFRVALPFGAAIDFEAGEVRRAPKWVRKIGMEWFFRFLQEPGRLFKRYFIDDMKIFWLAWKYRNEIIRVESERDL